MNLLHLSDDVVRHGILPNLPHSIEFMRLEIEGIARRMLELNGTLHMDLYESVDLSKVLHIKIEGPTIFQENMKGLTFRDQLWHGTGRLVPLDILSSGQWTKLYGFNIPIFEIIGKASFQQWNRLVLHFSPDGITHSVV